MKKLTSLFLLLLLVTASHAQLLWKISGNGLAKPSYVVGTNHLAPVTFVDSIPGLKAALDAADQVYGELDMRVMSDPAEMAKMQQAMMLPEGQSLDKLLSAEQLTRLNAFMKELMGVDMSNPMVAAQLGKMSPAALEAQFSVVMYLKKHPGFNPQQPFDGYFQQEAIKKGKPVGGLETVDFQANVLYKSGTPERQAEKLMCLVDNRDYNEDLTERMVKAFFGRDFEAIGSLLDEKMDNACDATPEEEDALIFNRNADWAKRLPAIMQEKSTFVAVGALHLPGDRGLLQLLKAAGYDVSPVK